MVGIALPSVAHAENKARLVYVRGDGAGGCPAEVDLRLWVMARLGYDPFSPQASRVVIARVEAREQRLFGSVEVADQNGLSAGQRELSSKNQHCDELARAMALSISLAIDPERATLAGDEPSATPVSTPAAPALAAAPAPAAVSASTPAVVPQETKPSHGFVHGVFESGVGRLPGLALGGAVGFGWRYRDVSLALEAHSALTPGEELAPRGSLTGSLLLAGLVGCAHFGTLGACAVGYGGRQRLSTHGIAQPETGSGSYVGVGPRLVLQPPLTRRLALLIGLEVVVHATRNRALLTDREVWKAPVLGATLNFGVGAHFL